MRLARAISEANPADIVGWDGSRHPIQGGAVSGERGFSGLFVQRVFAGDSGHAETSDVARPELMLKLGPARVTQRLRGPSDGTDVDVGEFGDGAGGAEGGFARVRAQR